MKRNLFEVNGDEKNRILKLHTIVNEQAKYEQHGVNVGGNITPTSKMTQDFYNYARQGKKDELYRTIYTYIQKPEDLNLLNDELVKLGTDIPAMLDKAFKSTLASNRTKSNEVLNYIKARLKNYADISWDSTNGQYIGNLQFVIKNPTAKADTRTPEQKKEDSIGKNDAVRKHIQAIAQSVKNGIITAGGGWNNKPWSEYEARLTPIQKEYARKIAPNVQFEPQSTQKATTQTTKIPEKFPLVKGMFGPIVKSLQEKLGVKQTGYFWNLTQAAVIKRTKELNIDYDPKVGLTEDSYTLIMES